jgi:hypothetical protein
MATTQSGLLCRRRQSATIQKLKTQIRPCKISWDIEAFRPAPSCSLEEVPNAKPAPTGSRHCSRRSRESAPGFSRRSGNCWCEEDAHLAGVAPSSAQRTMAQPLHRPGVTPSSIEVAPDDSCELLPSRRPLS